MRIYVDKLFIIVQFFLLALFITLFAFLLPVGANGTTFIHLCYSLFLVVCWPSLLKRYKECLFSIKVLSSQISSHLYFKKRCTVFFDRPVYVSFFKELLRPVDQYEAHDYVMVSNSPIPDFEPDTRFKTFDMSTQIIFPDTEKTRQAFTPLLASEFCVLQSGNPPPVESLWKKKKEELPTVKRGKSPDNPPPFDGKWNGRF